MKDVTPCKPHPPKRVGISAGGAARDAVSSVVAIVLDGKYANDLDTASMQNKELSYRYGRLGDALSAAFIGFFAVLFHERVLIAVITSAVIIINTR